MMTVLPRLKASQTSDLSLLDMPYTLPTEATETFSENGYIKLKDVFDADTLNYFGIAITKATFRLNTEDRPLEDRDTYDRAFLQVMNLWREDAVVKQFVFGKRLAKIAADLMQVDCVRLYHDQSLYKEAGGGLTPAHADQFYWPLSSERTVTVWVPLQAVPKDMGPLGFYKGSHKEDFCRNLEISDESEAQITAAMRRRGFEFDVGPFDLGEVSFHSGWTFHKAGPNLSSSPRSVMTMIYMDADICVTEPTNSPQKNDLASWLPGLKPGDTAASPINPILFDRAE